MKIRLTVALAIGVLIATTLLILEPFTDFALLSWEMPGISVAYLFWGAVGGTATAGIFIGWAVNALIYGLAALPVIILAQYLRPKLST